MQVILDAEKMKTAAEAHDYLQEMLRLPEYYGRNLDALYDCLTEMDALEIVFQNIPEKASESYADRVIRIFRDAARENSGLVMKQEN